MRIQSTSIPLGKQEDSVQISEAVRLIFTLIRPGLAVTDVIPDDSSEAVAARVWLTQVNAKAARVGGKPYAVAIADDAVPVVARATPVDTAMKAVAALAVADREQLKQHFWPAAEKPAAAAVGTSRK